MAKKPVTINDRKFDSVGEANEFFKHMRTSMHADKTIAFSGPIFETLDWVYREYCRVTEYPMAGEPVAYLVKNVTASGNGSSYGTTAAFHARFSDDNEEDFSILKAVRHIADHQKTGAVYPSVRAAADDLSV